MKIRDIHSSIIEGLYTDIHSVENIEVVTEGTNIDKNINESKFKTLQKKCNSAGYNISIFSLFRIEKGDKIHKNILITRKNESDNLIPQITFVEDKFYVHPSFMGDITEKEAKKMADNLVKAGELSSFLNKIDFEDYMTSDTPE